MGAKEIVPAIAVHKCRGLAVNGDIDRLVAGLSCTGLRVEFDETDVSEIGSVGEPEPAVRSHKESCVDGVAVFIHF